jgi:glycerol-3-phosphate O-acyltransferase 3/4
VFEFPAQDRQDSAERIKEHITREGSNRLLVFPEGLRCRPLARARLIVHPALRLLATAGVCVNNEYVVQFKKGVFELGATICPIAIKYNKVRCLRAFFSHLHR